MSGASLAVLYPLDPGVPASTLFLGLFFRYTAGLQITQRMVDKRGQEQPVKHPLQAGIPVAFKNSFDTVTGGHPSSAGTTSTRKRLKYVHNEITQSISESCATCAVWRHVT